MLARAPGCAVLFGGTGFIGGCFARFLVDGGHFQRALWRALELQDAEDAVALFKTLYPAPALADDMAAICAVAGVERRVPSVPYRALLAAGWLLDLVARPLCTRIPSARCVSAS